MNIGNKKLSNFSLSKLEKDALNSESIRWKIKDKSIANSVIKEVEGFLLEDYGDEIPTEEDILEFLALTQNYTMEYVEQDIYPYIYRNYFFGKGIEHDINIRP
jgi:hypothetical protein